MPLDLRMTLMMILMIHSDFNLEQTYFKKTPLQKAHRMTKIILIRPSDLMHLIKLNQSSIEDTQTLRILKNMVMDSGLDS